MSKDVPDIVGNKYGMLTVLEYQYAKRGSGLIWSCLCECGTVKDLLGSEVVRGKVKSCGCLSSKVKFKGHEELGLTYFNELRRGATKRNLEFSITIEFLWGLYLFQEGKCALTGKDILIDKDHKKVTASVDRIDSTKGYTPDNVQWVHKKVNTMKMDLPEDDFIDLCYAVCVHIKKIAPPTIGAP